MRKRRDGGGELALGCENQLKPLWVRDGGDDLEALSLEIAVKEMKIICCVAYGCQENDIVEKKNLVCAFLDEEVLRAKKSDSGFVMQT